MFPNNCHIVEQKHEFSQVLGRKVTKMSKEGADY